MSKPPKVDFKHILVWSGYSSWAQRIESLLYDLLPKLAIRLAVCNPPSIRSDTSFEWMRQYISAAENDLSWDLEEKIFHKTRRLFPLIRAYHGCRPENPKTYHIDGIVPLDYDLMTQRAKSFFKEVAGVTEDQFLEATKDYGRYLTNGEIWFSLNPVHIYKYACHYMIYGSEHIAGIAANLRRHIDHTINYQLFLKLIGKPTLLICNVPTVWLDYDTVLSLANNLITRYLNKEAGRSVSICDDDFCFVLRKRLPPRHIVFVHHPIVLQDRIEPGIYNHGIV